MLPLRSSFKRPELRYDLLKVSPRGRDMVIVYGIAALLGGLLSCMLLWPFGAAIAILSIPFSGSLVALVAAVLLYKRASHETTRRDDRAVYGDQPQTLQASESNQ
jgi:membrane protein implicated in regulation of membrane protease activity